MELKDYIAPMYEGEELIKRLTIHPEFDNSICNASIAQRLMALSDLYSLYIPTDMTVEIYYKLYLALVHSLSRKNTSTSTVQLYENQKAIRGLHYHGGILGGRDSLTITANSGLGKSSAISRAISIMSPENIIEIKSPYQKIIPFLLVQTPFDCSLKSLLLEILRKIDELLGTQYLFNSLRTRATTDILIGKVSTACLNHVAVLCLDEIQNVVNSNNGKNLVGSITQLINSSGIAIVFVGTPSVIPFLETDFMLARRMMNLKFEPLQYDQKFYEICSSIWQYQYIKYQSVLSDEVVNWLYNHSGGNISVVVSLIHDAQEIAILSGSERLNIEALNIAYMQRLSLLQGFLSPQERHHSAPRKNSVSILVDKDYSEQNEHLFSDVVSRAKVLKVDVLKALKEYIQIEEITI